MSKLAEEKEATSQLHEDMRRRAEASNLEVAAQLSKSERHLAEKTQEVETLELKLASSGTTEHSAQEIAHLAAQVAQLTTHGSAMATQLSQMEAQLSTSTEHEESLLAEVAKLTAHGRATQFSEKEAQLATSAERAESLVAELTEAKAQLESMTELAAAQAAAAEKDSAESFAALAETQRELAEWKEEATEAQAALGSSEVQRGQAERCSSWGWSSPQALAITWRAGPGRSLGRRVLACEGS